MAIGRARITMRAFVGGSHQARSSTDACSIPHRVREPERGHTGRHATAWPDRAVETALEDEQQITDG